MSEGSADEEMGGSEADTVSAALTHKVYKVLLVEDDETVLRVVEKLLRNCDYDVCLARNGREALEILEGSEGRSIDVILTDNLMPEVSGIELIYKLVQTERWQHVPVIVMSSESRQDVVLEAIEAGASDFLIKPIRRQELTTLWQHIWRNDRALRAKSCENPSSSSGRMGSGHLPGTSTSANATHPNGTAKSNAGSDTAQEDNSHAASRKRSQPELPDNPTASEDLKKPRLSAPTAVPITVTATAGPLPDSHLPLDPPLQLSEGEPIAPVPLAAARVHPVSKGGVILKSEVVEGGNPLGDEADAARQASLPVPQPMRVWPLPASTMGRAGSMPAQWKGLEAVDGAARLMEILAGHAKSKDAVLEIKPLDLTSNMDCARSDNQVEDVVKGLQGSLQMLHHSNSSSAFQSFTAVVPRPCARGEANALQATPVGPSAAAADSMPNGATLPMWAPHHVSPMLLQQQQFFHAFQVAVGQHVASNAQACAANRKAAIAKFRAKRKQRSFEKKVRYASRQRLAVTRPRVRGQFVKAAQFAAHTAAVAAGDVAASAPVPTAKA